MFGLQPWHVIVILMVFLIVASPFFIAVLFATWFITRAVRQQMNKTALVSPDQSNPQR